MNLFLDMFSAKKAKICQFFSTAQNTEVRRSDTGNYMKNYAFKNDMLKHP